MRRGRRYRQRVCCRHGKAAGGIEIRNSVRHRRRMPDAAKGPGMTPRMWLKTGIRKIINNQLQWGRDDSPDVARLFRPPSHGLSCFNGAGDGSPDITAVLLLSLLMIWRLQWSRGSLPGCNDKQQKAICAHLTLQWGRGSLPGCNSSGPPCLRGWNSLQWGRGSLPGCNPPPSRSRPATGVLQWGRGSLPGCNLPAAVPVPLVDAHASMGPGITPRM